MKTIASTSSLIVLFIIMTLSGTAQNSFQGEWKLNREKTQVGGAQLFMSKITVRISNDSLFTTRTYETSNMEEYPFTENLGLNGKESKIVIYDMPRRTKASRQDSDDSIQIESVTTFTGNYGEDNLITKESWKVNAEGNMLTISYSNKMSNGETSGVSYYTKVK